MEGKFEYATWIGKNYAKKSMETMDKRIMLTIELYKRVNIKMIKKLPQCENDIWFKIGSNENNS